MKQQLLLLFFLLTTFSGISQEYTITIDGQSFDVQLEQEFTYITENGDTVKFKLNQNGNAPVRTTTTNTSSGFENQGDSQVYEDVMIRFAYPENYAIAHTQPAPSMQQITMVSGEGSGILIQEFSTLNPKDLIDFTLSSLVGETYAQQAQSVNQQLGGQKVKGKRTTDEDGNQVVVYSYGKSKQGVIIALFGNHQNDQLLSQFLNDFQLKF